MSVFSGLSETIGSRWQLVRHGSGELRVFAGLELICFPLSLLTLLVLLPLRIILVRNGVEFAPGWHSVMTVLLSASIGYITNFIAIEMLFKPYVKSGRHPLSLLTLGYWQQGLVPKNKDRIGEELGHQIETRLLQPERLADELCTLVMAFVENPALVTQIKADVQQYVRSNVGRMSTFLAPLLIDTLEQQLEQYVTKDRVLEFMRGQVLPQLTREETRSFLATQIIQGFQRRSPDLMVMAKQQLRDYCCQFLSSRLPFGAESLSNAFVGAMDWDDLEQRLCLQLGSDETKAMICSEMVGLTGKVEEWLASPEGEAKRTEWVALLKNKAVTLLKDYLCKELPALLETAVSSEMVWTWVEQEALPAMKGKLAEIIRTQGKELLVERLNISGRVASAVQQQDVREFHEMINSVAAQHLGAIQVLGYVLGAVVGLTQLLL